MIHISARTIHESHSGVTIDVMSQASYRVVIRADEAHIIAPGLDKLVELDEVVYPLEEPEACAVMLVAQLEGGVEL